MIKKTIFKYFPLVLFLIFNSCGVYSFTGASISPETKTVSIQYFKNQAQTVKPTLSSTLTEGLKDRFSSQTSLRLVTNTGDLNFEGYIISYEVRPIAIQGNEMAALNRLTITINVKFTNIKDENQNFESNFSRYQDFPSNVNLVSVEEGLVKEIVEQLVDDIFNKSVVNW